MRYSYSDISQSVSGGKVVGKNILELTTGCDKGYENTLLKPYMKEIQQYSMERENLRVIMIANDTFSARQAYLCLINKFIRRMFASKETIEKRDFENEEEMEDYAQLYTENATDITVVEHVKVITDKYFKEIFDTSVKEGNNISLGLGVQRGMENFTGDNLLFELCHSYDADAIIDGILEQNNRCIAVMLTPGESCEYFIRRLAFEGDYDVLKVGRHSQNDYLECGRNYLEFHGFQLEEEEKLNEVIEKLQAYRGTLFTETDVYTLLAKETIKRLLAVKRVLRDAATNCEIKGSLHTNMIFAGNPGTGKSKIARVLQMVEK